MLPVFVPVPALSFGSPFMFVHADNWDYAPITEWGEGDLNAERVIAKELATPGRQIGIVSEAVVELSDHLSELLDVLKAQDTQNVDASKNIAGCVNHLKVKLDDVDSNIARLKRLVEKVDTLKMREKAKSPSTII